MKQADLLEFLLTFRVERYLECELPLVQMEPRLKHQHIKVKEKTNVKGKSEM